VIDSFIQLGRSRKVAGAMVDHATMHKQVLVLQMIGRFRTLGMFHADLDPLKRHEPRYIPDLDLATYGYTEADLDTEFDVGSFRAGTPRMRLRDLIAALRDTYCRTFGAEYMYVNDTPTKRFVQDRLEPIRSRPVYTPEQQRHILERLTAAETLERYLTPVRRATLLAGRRMMILMLDHRSRRRRPASTDGDRRNRGDPTRWSTPRQMPLTCSRIQARSES
jgi:2-oxoglutarate dehydrogenase E1 component